MGLVAGKDALSIVSISPPPKPLRTLDLAFRHVLKSISKTVFFTDDVRRSFLATFRDTVLTFDELLIFEYDGQSLIVTVKALSALRASTSERTDNDPKPDTDSFGIVMAETVMTFVASATPNTAKEAPTNFHFNFDDSIGGLDTELNDILRAAFASRRAPEDAKMLGVEHIKGILLHGPPGTGKTLIARKIADRVGGRCPIKIVNGPDIVHPWRGQSEKNVRTLFQDAEKEVCVCSILFLVS
jgi:vesicle-fusing ATPase